MSPDITRRRFMQTSAALVVHQAVPKITPADQPLQEVEYAQVRFTSPAHIAQLEETHTILMGLSDDSLLKPLRAMVGQPAPGEELGGWYQYMLNFDPGKTDAGLAPSATFGQWVSALCRYHAITGDTASRDKVLRLNRLYRQTIAPVYYENNRFPAYCFDKLVCGLMDSHRLVQDPDAFAILNETYDAAQKQLPGHAIDREINWRPGKDNSWSWDESYTMPENLYLVYSMGAGSRYLDMAKQYLDDATYFDPLARGENVLGKKHAYSYVNALCSAMQAYLIGGSEKHLAAARNGFDMLQQQSFATGGWGPDELLRKPGSEEVFASLTKSHNSFETPCGSYAHMKLTRYLLRVTRDGRYGDSMERIMYNTALGAKPLQPDGHAFYYSDYNLKGKRVYSDHRWPCCSGTLPQVATDYGINTYLRDPSSVWVNLYIPSVFQFDHHDVAFKLEQSGDYPFADTITFNITASRPADLTLRLRIPAWSSNPRIDVNGQSVPVTATKGFAIVSRTWKTGDVLTLTLPATLRLEPISLAHSETAALLYGPLVLFAITSDAPPITRSQALAAHRVSPTEWSIETAASPLRLLPFTHVGDAPYTAYLTYPKT
ncbi:beta-L-arabinofuranosidase domain-containing protein [Granulicella sp. L60]|uniref:beta-L-arabinofuranosidase domain-containing protein n=1 Tax=Granulicella sp. L60 TaxID=1641866 RepID=UPI00131C3E8B|nr:beta-L-arabinofuranosidase domain-containing protein [Granulicella sp. L60]